MSGIRSGLRIPTLCSCFALCLVATAPPAEAAGWDFGARMGYYTDVEELGLGLEALYQIGDSPWMFNPNIEYVFVENGDLWSLAADFHYDFDLDMEAIDVYAGGGPALLFGEFERGNAEDVDDTDFGLDLIAGAAAKRGGVRPYGQIKVIVSDETEVALQVGLRFY
jgi:hypothetical protein